MLVKDIENLLQELEVIEVNNVPDVVLQSIDDILCRHESEISEEVFLVYKKFLPMKSDVPEGLKIDLFSAIKNYIQERIEKYAYIDALLLSRFIIAKFKLSPVLYSNIAEILASIGEKDLALEFIEIYKSKESNKPLYFLTVANFYNIFLNEYKTAIKYYEQYLRIDETKAVVYTIVGSLYAKAYGDFSLNDQIYYYEKAHKLKPEDNVVIHSLAIAYEKLQDKNNANKYYSKLLQNNPKDSDYYNYGAFLISCGDFEKGYKYLTHRFNIENNINLKYPIKSSISKKWDFSMDISQKTLLVHYEQGFGDTIMYCRYLPQLKSIAKHIIFVVQENLCDLIKSCSLISDGIEVISDNVDISTIEYDYDMALIDAVYAVEASVENIPYPQGYLNVSDKQICDYKQKYINKSKNIRVGISCCGAKDANYNNRDINISKFKKLFELQNIDFYLFSQIDENIDNVINLYSSFKDFSDTAAAIKNMDIIISTDNVILNLAGALGVKTYGLFNKYPNFRWYKLEGNNVGWYDSVIPMQVSDENYWTPVIDELFKILSK